MRKINKKEGIAIFTSLVVVAYLMYGGSFLNLFYSEEPTNMTENNVIETGVKTEDLKVGTGALVAIGDTVTVHYVGTLTDGTVFDSSVERGTPFSFVLGSGQVIRGWEEGFVGMRVLGKRRITVAPDYGYGNQRVGPIPPNSVLIFEVELLGTEKK